MTTDFASLLNVVGPFLAAAIVLGFLWFELRARMVVLTILAVIAWTYVGGYVGSLGFCMGYEMIALVVIGLYVVSFSAKRGRQDRDNAIGPLEDWVDIFLDEQNRPYEISRVAVRKDEVIVHRYANSDQINQAYEIASRYWNDGSYYKTRVDYKAREIIVETFDYAAKDKAMKSASNACEALVAGFNNPPIITRRIKF